MALSEARARATKKYQAKFERIYIRVTQEEKESIEAYAEEIGESVNTFVRRAIAETMERGNAESGISDKVDQE
jgi:predicted HicB family RNase H-like nuclease